MLNILRSELFKLKRNRAFKICMILAIVYSIVMMGSMIFMALLLKGMSEELPPGFFDIFEMGGMEYFVQASGISAVRIAIVNDGMILMLITAVLVCSVITTDHQRGIFRNLLASGHSRSKVYMAKLIICLGIALMVFLLSTVIYFVPNSIAFGIGQGFGRFLQQYLLAALLFLGFTCILVMLASVTKSTGVTVGISIALILVLGLLPLIAGILEIIEEVPEAVTRVVKFVSEIYVGNIFASSIDSSLTASKMIQFLITGIITVLASTGIGILHFKQTDLK